MSFPTVLAHVVAPLDGRPGIWTWTFDPIVLAGLVWVAAAYLGAVSRVRRTRSSMTFPARRVACFLGGLAAIAVALLSPVDAYAGWLLSVHMVQHVLLTMVAAPLIVLGAPVSLALAASPAGGRRVLHRFLHGRVLRVVGAPLVGWIAFVAAMWIWHLPSLYDTALEHEGVHAVEHLIFLVTALLFWWPLVGLDPNPHRPSHPGRLLLLFLSMPAMAILGLSISTASHVLYAPYATATAAIGVSPISDQHLGGAIMWEGSLLLMMPALVLVLLDWMQRDERAAERADARRLRSAGAATIAPASGERGAT
ncbi:MAG TPA: cytochrome c oxidase assembly protein [Actinomycetota bacterium]|jgi:cytochrome c oxidase assembly factor CtaG